MEHEYVLNYLASDLQQLDNMMHPKEKYREDLMKLGEQIHTKVSFEQFEKLFYTVNDNYYSPSEKLKLMLIVIYNMF